MSCSPKAFGGYEPAGQGLPSPPSWKFANAGVSAAPNANACIDSPARQAYSHSASVGNRYTRPAFFSAAHFDSAAQNALASSHVTDSTGNVPAGPGYSPSPSGPKKLGFSPVTASYSHCVTGKTPSQNARVS